MLRRLMLTALALAAFLALEGCGSTRLVAPQADPKAGILGKNEPAPGPAPAPQPNEPVGRPRAEGGGGSREDGGTDIDLGGQFDDNPVAAADSLVWNDGQN